MPATTATEEWIQLPSGLYVSADSMQKDGKRFSLYDTENMDVAAFNKEAARYDVHIGITDAPIDRLVKYSVFLARRDKDGSRIMTNEEYVDMLLEVAAGKAKEPFASFYKALKAGHVDATRDVLEFHGKVSEGSDKGKYEVKLLRFDDEGNLQPIDEILVAPEGWVVALETKHKFPVETTAARIQNLEIPGIEDDDASGYWHIGVEPKKGDQRINIRAPDWDDGRLLRAGVHGIRSYFFGDVGALRSRRAA